MGGSCQPAPMLEWDIVRAGTDYRLKGFYDEDDEAASFEEAFKGAKKEQGIPVDAWKKVRTSYEAVHKNKKWLILYKGHPLCKGHGVFALYKEG